MRRHLPIALILLAALSGQAFGAVESWQPASAGELGSLARLVQNEYASALQGPARSPGLTVLAGGLTMLVWPEAAEQPGLLPLPAAQAAQALPARCRSAAAGELPADQARMRPPVDRGP